MIKIKKLYILLITIFIVLTMNSATYGDTGVGTSNISMYYTGDTDIRTGTPEPMPDGAYGAINPSYRISDSPHLRLPDDMRNCPLIVSPEPCEVDGIEDPTAVEMYNIATGEAIRIPSNDTTQQPIDSDLNSTLSYQGLLPRGIVPETVFPPDDRARIDNTETFPWRTVCKLFSTFPDGALGGCSGAIIGCPDDHGYHVLTAGHCVYSHDHGGWATSVKVVPGLNDDYMPYNYAWATHLRSYTGWTVDHDHRHDWALITLDRNVGDFAGWMGRKTADPDDPVYTGALNLAGYPGDKDCGTPDSDGLCMYFDTDDGRTATEHNHWYYMDTTSGMSGSPVWIYHTNPEHRYILTIHAYGNDGSDSNHGTRLNQDKFDRIDTWCNEDTPPTDYADLIDDGQAWSGFSPTLVDPGVTNFNVWCDVRNVGTESSGNFHVSYYASTNTIITESDYLIGTDYVSSTSPFDWGDLDWLGTFPSSVPDGTYWIGWIIDNGGDVTEFDENNNKAYKSSYQLIVDGTNPPAPTISSASYPDENEWYSDDNPLFTWTTPPDTSGVDCYSYTLDQPSITTPDTECDTTENSVWYSDVSDGIWYFHVRAKDNAGNWGSADHYKVKIDTANPEGWQNFNPTDWVKDQTPDCTIEVKDVRSGLDVSTALYKYSSDGGPTWSGWISASCTGSDGITPYQTITADSVPFNQDSGTQNKIKFRIDDMVGNTGESGEYTVKIDAADPSAPVISSSTHPDEDEWDSGNDPAFHWTTPSDTSGISCYSYIFDQSATTTPDIIGEPAGNSGSYTDVADGIWYFYVRAKDNAGNWGDADHYRVKIGSSEASTTDAVIALAIAAGSREYDSRWDVSGDGSVTSLDALMILQAAAGDIELGTV